MGRPNYLEYIDNSGLHSSTATANTLAALPTYIPIKWKWKSFRKIQIPYFVE